MTTPIDPKLQNDNLRHDENDFHDDDFSSEEDEDPKSGASRGVDEQSFSSRSSGRQDDRSYYDDADDRSYRSSQRSADDRSYLSGEGSVDDRSYRSGESSVDDRSYRSGDDHSGHRSASQGSQDSRSYHSSEQSYRSGDSRSFPGNAEDGFSDNDGHDSFGSFEKTQQGHATDDVPSSPSISPRSEGGSRSDSYREDGSRPDSYRVEGSRSGSYREGDSFRSGSSKTEGSYDNEALHKDDDSYAEGHALTRKKIQGGKSSSFQQRDSFEGGQDPKIELSEDELSFRSEESEAENDVVSPEPVELDKFGQDDFSRGSGEHFVSDHSGHSDHDSRSLKSDRSHSSRSRSIKSHSDRSHGSRSYSDKSHSSRSHRSRSHSNRSHSNRSRNDRSYGSRSDRSDPSRSFHSENSASRNSASFRSDSQRSKSYRSELSGRDESVVDGSHTSNRSWSKRSYASGENTAEASHIQPVDEQSRESRSEGSHHTEDSHTNGDDDHSEVTEQEKQSSPQNEGSFSTFGEVAGHDDAQYSPNNRSERSSKSGSSHSKLSQNESEMGDDFPAFGNDTIEPSLNAVDASKQNNVVTKPEILDPQAFQDGADFFDNDEADDAFFQDNEKADGELKPVNVTANPDATVDDSADAFRFDGGFGDAEFDKDAFGDAAFSEKAKPVIGDNTDTFTNAFDDTSFDDNAFGDAAFDDNTFDGGDEKKDDSDALNDSFDAKNTSRGFDSTEESKIVTDDQKIDGGGGGGEPDFAAFGETDILPGEASKADDVHGEADDKSQSSQGANRAFSLDKEDMSKSSRGASRTSSFDKEDLSKSSRGASTTSSFGKEDLSHSARSRSESDRSFQSPGPQPGSTAEHQEVDARNENVLSEGSFDSSNLSAAKSFEDASVDRSLSASQASSDASKIENSFASESSKSNLPKPPNNEASNRSEDFSNHSRSFHSSQQSYSDTSSRRSQLSQEQSASHPPSIKSQRSDNSRSQGSMNRKQHHSEHSSSRNGSSFKLEMEPEDSSQEDEGSIRLGEVFGKPNELFEDYEGSQSPPDEHKSKQAEGSSRHHSPHSRSSYASGEHSSQHQDEHIRQGSRRSDASSSMHETNKSEVNSSSYISNQSFIEDGGSRSDSQLKKGQVQKVKSGKKSGSKSGGKQERKEGPERRQREGANIAPSKAKDSGGDSRREGSIAEMERNDRSNESDVDRKIDDSDGDGERAIERGTLSRDAPTTLQPSTSKGGPIEDMSHEGGAESIGQSSRSKRRRKRRRKKTHRSKALIELEANLNDTMLAMEEAEDEQSESGDINRDTAAHDLLYGFEALLGGLDQLFDELEIISTFAKPKKKKASSSLVSAQALKAVLSFAAEINILFLNLKVIIEDCFFEDPDEYMAEALNRLGSLADLLLEMTHHVGEKQEWNKRAETAYVTLIELMARESLELSCYFDDAESTEFELSENICEAWLATGHVDELTALEVAEDPLIFSQICYEVLVSTDQWCPDTDILMDICGIDPSLLEEEPIEFLDEEDLALIPEAAEHVLDKINGAPLPRTMIMASILRRILPPRAVIDKTVLDYFTSVRYTRRNHLRLPVTNMVSITSIPQSLDEPGALGVGGVGKTTLAAMVAMREDVRNYFVDGVVWVYVGDKELNYTRYTQCLNELVAQLDSNSGSPVFPELIHTPGEPLTKRRRREQGFMSYARDTITDILHGKSVLIILDDVCFEPDLEWFDFNPMMPDDMDGMDGSCAILATTRCRELLPYADTVEVDMLDEADAVSLLIRESGELCHSLMAESREARAVVRECANHALAVKSAGRWLNLKHATAGVVSSVEEIHAEVIRCMDKIVKGGHSDTDMMYEILSLSLSPELSGTPTVIMKFCLASFVVVFCDKNYISDYSLVEQAPLIPRALVELLFETLLELNESSLLKEGSLFSAQKNEARVLIPEALCSLGILKLINAAPPPDSHEEDEDSVYYQIMHFIHQEYGEYVSNDDEALRDITKDSERQWNRAFVDAYVARVGEWDLDVEDPGHSYALEMIISHMIRGTMYKEAAELLADKDFVRGRLRSLGRETATKRHVKDCEMLFTKLRARRGKGQARLEARTVMKQAYQTLGGLLMLDNNDESLLMARMRDVEVAWAHYEIGFSLAEKRCWDAAIAHWETSQELFVSSKGTVELVAAILYNIGVVYSEMNEYERALDSLKQCLRIRGTIHGEAHILYAQTIQKIGDVFLGMSDYHEAMESYDWALDIMFGEPGYYRVDIGEILDNKGIIYNSKGETDKALNSHKEALRSKGSVLGEHHPELATTYDHIGLCMSEEGDIATAITHYDEATRLLMLDPEGGPERDAEVLRIEGILHNLEGNSEEGVECYEKALQILVAKVPHRKVKIASLLHLIGCIYIVTGESKKAMKLFEESLQARRKVLGFVHLDVACTLYNMSFLHQSRNRLDKALKCLEEALKIRVLRLPDSEKVAVTHEKIGTVARAIGKTKKAENAFEEALRIRKQIHGEDHETVATILQELGDLMDDLGEYEFAMDRYVKALEIRKARLGSNDPSVADTLRSMGYTLHNSGQTDRALECFEESLAIQRFHLGEDCKEVGDILNMMGFLKAKKEDLDDAMAFLWTALRIRKEQEDHVKVSETLKNIGNVHRAKDQHDLALECYEECLRIRVAELGGEHEKVADAFIAMGNVQSTTGQTDEAMRSYQEALKIRTMVYGEHDENVAAVLQYMGMLESRAENHERARDLLTEFVRIRRDNNDKGDADYVNVLFTIGNIHKMQGNEDEARLCWAEAHEVFHELGLEESNPKTAKVMNHLLKVELKDPEEDEKKKKKKNTAAGGVFGKVTSKLKDTIDDAVLAPKKTKKKKKEKKPKRSRKGKGIQL